MGNSTPAPPTSGQFQSWANRNGFADWVMALIWLFLCLTLFQLIAMVIAGGGYVLAKYLFDYQELLGIINSLKQGDVQFLTKNLSFLFIINSTWQILFLGLGTYFFVRTCSGRHHRKQYLRLKPGPALAKYVALSALLIVVVQPVIWFLGWLNTFIPVPDFFKNLQQSQMELIGDFLKNNNNVAFALFNVALVPALCEEILFRGFVLRSFEKKWGIKISIILSGLLFGLYHIQLSNLLPLAFIGMILGFVAWRAQSIYPAMVVHFINNGASVLVAIYYPHSAIAENSPATMPPLWLIVASGAISAYLIFLMINDQLNSQGVSHA